jgi:hypothetical protein
MKRGGENEKRRKEKKERNLGCLEYVLPFRLTGVETR